MFSNLKYIDCPWGHKHIPESQDPPCPWPSWKAHKCEPSLAGAAPGSHSAHCLSLFSLSVVNMFSALNLGICHDLNFRLSIPWKEVQTLALNHPLLCVQGFAIQEHLSWSSQLPGGTHFTDEENKVSCGAAIGPALSPNTWLLSASRRPSVSQMFTWECVKYNEGYIQIMGKGLSLIYDPLYECCRAPDPWVHWCVCLTCLPMKQRALSPYLPPCCVHVPVPSWWQNLPKEALDKLINSDSIVQSNHFRSIGLLSGHQLHQLYFILY